MPTSLTLVRRGLAFAGDCQRKYSQHSGVTHGSKKPEDTDRFLRHIAARFQSPASILVLATTLLAFFVVLSSLEYAIRFVATRLAIVEHVPTTGAIVLTDEPDAPLYKAPLIEDVDGEEKLAMPAQPLGLLPSKPITAKLRTTMQFLRSQGGFRAKFRGLQFGLFYMTFMSMFAITFELFFAAILGPVGAWIGSTLAAVVCCNAHATWTHAVIANADDNNKTFFQRFLPSGVARKLIAPTIRLHVQLGLMHCAVLGTGAVAFNRMAVTSAPSFLMLLPVVLGLVMGLGAVLPAYIALVRVEASLLPEDMTAIVPFDRTFGGRMEKLSAENKCRFARLRNMTMKGAFMTFDRDAYKRTVKMLVKYVALSSAFYFAFVALFITELYMIIGGAHNVRKLLAIADRSLRGDL